MIIIFTTIHDRKQTKRMAKGLVMERLVACVNILPVESVFRWKGKLEEIREQLLILKTTKKNFKKIERYIKKHSGYEIPEIVAIPASAVHAPYLKWVKAETK
ncbi:hypothetical protein A3A21_02985 [Candidatus Jorgensenbacteria bacterium RIFCSPLOWO2_01_FULL_45_25b]|uniref:Divalent-cation tolerance protein CutA n=1 Tax=Candidatus Jorgensenbacteria bacterium RIFCSPLOWO2_01_FULL_45_25b TaxID=1798471 RepID=A0A1F6BXZ1_9BACT|nr:MAG: hypothetical protein A3A21_02985 [Candidatus Jorgensenbacteria bacterium RIFCSPLOWO2_01_FULL_45_25b]